MGETYTFKSPVVKLKEKDLTLRSSRSEIVDPIVDIPTGENNTNKKKKMLIPKSMLQWVTGVMYNDEILMYNYKLWTNDKT